MPSISALFLPHGGGPLPLLNDPRHHTLINHLREITKTFSKPKKILIISAHWEESKPTLLKNPQPSLYFDYYGFPKESYKFKYPAPLDVQLTEKIEQRFKEDGIDYQIDQKRNYDHGVFVPLMLMYPEADIPLTQLSLLSSLEPQSHIKIGQSLAPLLEEEKDLLIVGSGMSYHNLSSFSSAFSTQDSEKFHEYLKDACCNESYSQEERLELLKNWATAPRARQCHPREEHLLPLLVVAGITQGRPGSIAFEDQLFGSKIISVSWPNH